MDKINFAHAQTPYVELQLARWYTTSCLLIVLMLIGMCSIYVIQWRTYQHAIHTQKSYATQRSLEQEYVQLQTQHQEHHQRASAQKITCQQLTGLQEGLAQDITLQECVITRDGSHTLTLTAPSRQRAQECIAFLNKRKLFGTLTLTSLKTVKNGDRNYLLVTLKGIPALQK
jgi:cell division protein FtsL